MRCRICDNATANVLYEVRELAHAQPEHHLYFQCSHCGCLQIVEFPPNIGTYYDTSYYSYQPPVSHDSIVSRSLVSLRNRYAIFGRGMVGRALCLKYPAPQLHFLRPVSEGISAESRILDIGCGAGHLLYALREAGFANLLGIDPFVEEDIVYDSGVVVRKQLIQEVRGCYDLAIMQHSFEHVADPWQTLRCAFSLLAPGAFLIVGIPTVSSYAWEHYGVDWVQLDAPRHFYLHSLDSVRLLTSTVGFELYDVVFDSGAFQFWGSEQHKRGIELFADERSYWRGQEHSIFSASDIALYAQRANDLNAAGRGDQAVFYLRKPATRSARITPA